MRYTSKRLRGKSKDDDRQHNDHRGSQYHRSLRSPEGNYCCCAGARFKNRQVGSVQMIQCVNESCERRVAIIRVTLQTFGDDGGKLRVNTWLNLIEPRNRAL